MSKFIDLTGKTFHRLTVIRADGHYMRGKQKDSAWLCLCSCGKHKRAYGNSLKTGHIRSCGCLLTEWRAKKGKGLKPGVAARSVFGTYKYGAKKRGLAFDLTFEDFLVLSSSSGEIFNYNGIDRLDNSQGYIKGNWVSCCDWCNFAKNNGTLEEFIEKCRAVTQYQNAKLLKSSLPKIVAS